MGSVGTALRNLRTEISNLPVNPNEEGTVLNPLIRDKNIVSAATAELIRRSENNTLPEPEVQQVFLDRVYTKQEYLYKDKLEDYADKPIHELANGYKYQGNVIITDGNHRIALAKLNNQGTARMNIIDLDKPVKKKGILSRLLKKS